MPAVGTNRVAAAIERVRERLDALDAASREELDAQMALGFEEHFQYQEWQARAHASGRLATEEAQLVYAALGEVGCEANGGWASGTDTATKVAVTMLMGELTR